MIDLTNYKILLYHYPYTTKELEIMIWDKMDTVDSRFAVKLTIGGVNDSGEYDDTSWDLFFLEPKLEEKIDLMLDKYETQYVKTDYTELLGQKREEFTEEFMFKLLDFLNKGLEENRELPLNSNSRSNSNTVSNVELNKNETTAIITDSLASHISLKRHSSVGCLDSSTIKNKLTENALIYFF